MSPDQEKEIERLYLSMYNKLLVYAIANLQSESVAEEAVQETFRIACTKPDVLCSSPNSKGWLVQTLKYVISNIRHHQATATRILAEYLASQTKDIAMTEDRISLDVMYGDLSDSEDFLLLKGIAVDGKSTLELAQERGISLAACRKRIQRAKALLRKKISL